MSMSVLLESLDFSTAFNKKSPFYRKNEGTLELLMQPRPNIAPAREVPIQYIAVE